MMPSLDEAESIHNLKVLEQVDLPNATKYLVTHGKLDAAGSIKTLNAGAGYPGDWAQLRTLSAWACLPFVADPQFRDGFALFCVRRLLEREHTIDHLLLLNDSAGLSEQWLTRCEQVESAPLMTFRGNGSGTNLILNRTDERAMDALDLLWNLYRSGAVYGLAPYGIEEAVEVAKLALGLSPVATSTH